MPVRKGSWWRYARTVEGQQYAIHCRRRVRDGEVTPPIPEDGKPLDGEEVLLDGNELAAGTAFFSLGALSVSARTSRCSPTPPTSPATSGTRCGSRTWRPGGAARRGPRHATTAAPGRWTAPPCSTSRSTRRGGRTGSGGTWSARPRRTTWWCSRRPTRSSGSASARHRDERYLVIRTASKLTSEVRLLDAATPTGEFTVVAPRRQGVEYGVEVAGDRLLILHNDGGGELRARHRAAARRPGSARRVVDAGDRAPGRHPAAVGGRVRRLPGALLPARRADRAVGAAAVRGRRGAADHVPRADLHGRPGANPEYTQTRFRLGYNSMVTPSTVYDYDMATGSLTR